MRGSHDDVLVGHAVRRVVGVWFVVAMLVSTGAAAVAVGRPRSPTVGSTIKTRNAAVPLHAFRSRVGALAAINVEICDAGTGAPAVRRGQFFLETQDRRLLSPTQTSDAPRPQLHTTRLARGHCLRGWVDYLV